MHEMGIVLHLAKTLDETAEQNQLTKIGRVTLQVGEVSGIISGFLLSFISIAKELDLIAILMTPKNYTLSFLAFDYSKEAMPQVSDAICIVIIAFILITNRIADKLGGNVSKSM